MASTLLSMENGARMETAAGRRRSTRRATAPAAAEGKIERLDERPPVAARDSGVIARVGPARCLQSGGAVDSREVDGVQGEISYRSLPRAIPGCEGGRGSAALAAGPMTAGLVGSGRVRRHPHRRARSAPQCGVSRGPRACRVRVPIETGRRPPRGGRTGRFAQAADFPLFGGLRCQRRGVANFLELLPKLSLIIHEIAIDLGVAQQRSDI